MPYAIQAADEAEAAGAWDESVTYLRMALELAPEEDVPPIRGRLAIALAWALQWEEAVAEGKRAGAAIAGRSVDEAASFYADLVSALSNAGNITAAWEITPAGLKVVGDKRNLAWVRLTTLDLLRREAHNPDYIGVPVATPERLELAAALDALPLEYQAEFDGPVRALNWDNGGVRTRAEVLAVDRAALNELRLTAHLARRMFLAGEARVPAAEFPAAAGLAERRGSIAVAVANWAFAARANVALGNLEVAREYIARSRQLAERLTMASIYTLQLIAADDELRAATREGWREAFGALAGSVEQPSAVNAYARASIQSAWARGAAYVGNGDLAIALIGQVLPAIEKAPGWASNYPRIACSAGEALWVLGRTDYAEPIERAIREKLLPPDLRYINVDPRLSLARLCALTGRFDEAREWFADARSVLEESGWRPLRALADYDEALMYIRRAGDGDVARARPFLEGALTQFQEIGMTGWQRHAEELLPQLT